MPREFYDNHFQKRGHLAKAEIMKQETRLEHIKNLLDGSTNGCKQLLIVGCGVDEDVSIVEKPVVAFDFSFEAVRIARNNFPENKYAVIDGCHIAFRDNSFDCIICSEVLEHVDEPEKMLLEFKRILSPAGCLILTVPNWHSFYGLSRKIAEFVLRKPVTAAGQPIDHWYTRETLLTQVSSWFSVKEWCGIWHYPPTGKGRFQIPDCIVCPIFRFFKFIDDFVGRRFPRFGHMIAVKAVKKVSA